MSLKHLFYFKQFPDHQFSHNFTKENRCFFNFVKKSIFFYVLENAESESFRNKKLEKWKNWKKIF